MSEAPQYQQHPRQINPKPSRRFAEEDRAWALLYEDIGQASTAEEVVKQLDADTQAKHSHLALFLRAKTTLRKQKAVDARNQRVGAFLRLVVTTLLIGPVRLLRSMLSNSADVAVEMLPPARREPAKARVGDLTKDPQFAKANERFSAGADSTRPATAQQEESRGVPKAA